MPNVVKAVLCLTLTIGLWQRLPMLGTELPAHPFALVLILAQELLLGLALGLAIRFIFGAIQTGGQLIGFQMGFAMVNAIDPDSGTTEAVTAHFLYMVSLLAFLSFNGHLYLFDGLLKSFDLIPPGSLVLSPRIGEYILGLSGQLFLLSIQIGAPVIAALLLVDLALALVSRASPQMNVLIVGFPLKIGIGFLFLSLIFTIISMHMEGFVSKMPLLFSALINALR